MSGTQSWQCQGRQQHGWFGDGTCAKAVRDAANGSVAPLPPSDRARCERWLRTGGIAAMQRAASSLFGGGGDATATGSIPTAVSLAEAIRSVGLDRSPQVVAESALPERGEASTYSDFFVGKETASSGTYSHSGFTAALLPRARWHAVPLGTRLRLTFHGRTVVVVVNDRGKGTGGRHRVLDLSRAAMAALLGIRTGDVTDKSAGVIESDKIEIVPPAAPLGAPSGSAR